MLQTGPVLGGMRSMRERGVAARDLLYLASLAALFILSFAVPVAFAVRLVQERSPEASEVFDGPFPSVFEVRAANTYLSVPHTGVINPHAERDFLFVSWFQPRRLPSPGERMTLFSKLTVKSDDAPGFALALSGERDAVRPMIYWRGVGAGQGRWMSFSELPLVPRTWVMLALSFRDQRYLGLHAVLSLPNEERRTLLLGGYDLEELGVPANDAELRLGSIGANRFRGAIGRFGVFQVRGLSALLAEALEQFATAPDSPPRSLPSPVLWYRAGDDSGSIGTVVSHVREGRR